MEKISFKIANKISSELNFDEDKRQVVQYGLLALVQLFFYVFFIVLIGIFFGVALEALVVLFSVSLLRKYSGGAHSDSIIVCTVFGVFFCLAFSIIIKHFIIGFISFYSLSFLMLIIYATSFLLIDKYAPVDNPNKPIKTEKKRLRMKKYSYATLLFYFAVSLALLFFGKTNKILFSYDLCLLVGVIWQVFTLTGLGIKSIKLVDFISNKILMIKRR